ncbi:hypothetical protein DUNSADRAFT_9949 [Dunaliella salina]|uniref:Encoded protein n=1 Tax=Dunaliella salina TaxID=3046 RepID=A0ABQ7GGE3_DUNSA|nr:hypothetical protein DUNSADRAFT_9949 [Dunaliella salina]|eukprot:KAF5833678.1 hypothetical protein DUNSADRAFT_9949 [Dunaliella salina]
MVLMPASSLPFACGICVGVILCSALTSAADWASSMGSMGTVCICTLSLLVWIMHIRATKSKAAREEDAQTKLRLAPSGTEQADEMATQGKPRAEHLLLPRALVHALLDMLQNGEVPPDQDLDLLRGLLIESQEVGLPSTLEMLHERSFEPAVEDSILFVLGQKPLFPAMGQSYSNLSDRRGQNTSEDREAEAASFEHILKTLAQERSVFDASTGSFGKRSIRRLSSFKRRPLLSPRASSGSNTLQSEVSNAQLGHPCADGLAGSSPTTQYEGTQGNTPPECEDTLPPSRRASTNVQLPAPGQPQMQSNRGGRRSIGFDSAFGGMLDSLPTAASALFASLGGAQQRPAGRPCVAP